MPTQPLLPARSPPAESAVEAPAEGVPVPTIAHAPSEVVRVPAAVQAPVQAVPVPAAVDPPVQVVSPVLTAKKARQYDLLPHQPRQPIPRLQPPLQTPALPASALPLLKAMPKFQRMDMFNTMFNLYLRGRYFQQDSVNKEFWMEDPRPLTHSNDQQIRNLRRNRLQGDIVLIDFLQTDVVTHAEELSDTVSSDLVGTGSLREEEEVHVWHSDWH